MRVVVDASVWISARLNPKGHPARILEAYWNGLFSPVTSEAGLAEVADVLARPRITRKYGVTAADVETYVGLLREGAEVVPVQGGIRVGRDPDDDQIIETAIAGKADFVVSRDEDLTRDPDVRRFLTEHGIEVLTVRRFLELVRPQEE